MDLTPFTPVAASSAARPFPAPVAATPSAPADEASRRAYPRLVSPARSTFTHPDLPMLVRTARPVAEKWATRLPTDPHYEEHVEMLARAIAVDAIRDERRRDKLMAEVEALKAAEADRRFAETNRRAIEAMERCKASEERTLAWIEGREG